MMTSVQCANILGLDYDSCLFTSQELRDMCSDLEFIIETKIDNNVDIFTSGADIRYFETEKFREQISKRFYRYDEKFREELIADMVH
mgnify:CR=1 FL=1